MNRRIACYSLIAALAAGPVVLGDDHRAAAPAAAHTPTAPAPKNAPAPVNAPAPKNIHASADAHAPASVDATPAPGGHASGAVAAVSPNDALAQLVAGNARFTSGAVDHPRFDQNRRCDTFVGGQHPIAAILSCADSRVAPELLFDQGIGDLFVIRVAGNVADTNEIGTIEYGVGHLNIPVVVVIGHTKCGAVTAVVDGAAPSGALGGLLAHIKPASDISKRDNPALKGPPLVAAAIRENVRQSIRDMMARSADITHAVQSGRVKIVGAIYDIHSGSITWLDQSTIVGADTSDAHGDATPKATPGIDPKTGFHDAPVATVPAAAHADPHAKTAQPAARPHAAASHGPAAKGHHEPVKSHDFAKNDGHEKKETPSASGISIPTGATNNFLALGILLAGASGVSMGVFHLMNQVKRHAA